MPKPLPPLPSRYEPRALLGTGGMGVVERVFDRERGEEVALKRFAPPEGADDAEGRFLFKQEFWAMAAMPHPHLVAAYDYGEDAGVPYFTMALAPGRELAEDVPAPEDAVRAWLPGLLAALGSLHARGWLHADLKPENVRVDGGRATLMDLGLLTPIGRAGGAVRGTLAYLAPEAIRAGAVDARSDLYALGAVLFHVLTGAPPYPQTDTLGLLKAHLEAPVPTAAGVSPEMAAALRKAMAKEPAARFPDVGAFAAALGLDVAVDAPGGLLAAPLVGRDAALAAVRAGLGVGAVLVTGEPGSGRTRLLDAVRAEAPLSDRPVLVARGEGPDAPPYAALRPWLAAVGRGRGARFAALAPYAARIVPGLGVAAAPALEGAPERLRAHDAIVALATEAVRPGTWWLLDDADRLDAASRELVEALARAGQLAGWGFGVAGGPGAAFPGATVVELGPLAADDVVALAAAMLGVGPEGVPAAVAERLAALSEGKPGLVAAALAHWVEAGALRRGAGGTGDGAADGGTPGGAAGDAAGDAAGGAAGGTRGQAGGWHVTGELVAPPGVAEAIAAQVAALGPEAGAVARTAAGLARRGGPLDLALLAGVADLAPEAFFAGLAALRGADVLRTEGDRFRFAREAAIEALAGPEDPALHGRAFRFLMRRADGAAPASAPASAPRPLDVLLALARHGLAGEAPGEAIRWAIAAAEGALALHAVATAGPLIAAALAVPGLDAGGRLHLLAHQGYVYRFESRIDEALALYDEVLLPALRAQPPGPMLAEHLVTGGVLRQLKGRYDDALAAYAEATELADAVDAPRQAVRARVFAGRVGVFSGQNGMARTVLTAAVRRARDLAAAGDDAARAMLGRALSLLGYLLGTSGEADRVAEGLAMLDEAVAIDRAIGDLRETHEALNNLGNVHMALGRYADARAGFAACLELTMRMNSPNEALFAHINLGAALLELGRPVEAEAHAREAATAAHAQGRAFPEGCARGVEGAALVRLGRPGEGLARLRDARALADASGNKYLQLNLTVYEAQARLDAGLWEAAADAVAQGEALAAETGNAEYAGKLARLAGAIAALTGAAPAPGAAADGTAAAQAGSAAGGAAGTQAGGAAEAQAGGTAEAQAGGTAGAQAGGAIAWLQAAAEAQREPGAARAHALRALGAARLAAGDGDAAARTFEAAVEMARDAGLARVEAEALLGLAAARGPAGGGAAREAVTVAEEAQDALGAALAEALLARRTGDARAERAAVSRLQVMADDMGADADAFWRDPARAALRDLGGAEGGLSPARVRHLTALIAAIADAEDLEAVKDQALHGLIALAGAERGHLVLYDGFAERERLFGATRPDLADDGFSSFVAEQVLWTGEPFFVEDAATHEGLAQQASVMALALRSVLGLPLRARGNTFGVLMADSRAIGKQLSEAELALALALAQAVAGAIDQREREAAVAAERAALRAVRDLAFATAGVTDPAAFARAALDAALAATGAERGFVLAADPEADPEADLGAAPLAGGDPRDVSASVCRWVAENGKPVHMVDVQSEEAFQTARSVMALGLRTIWAAPAGSRALIYLDSQRIAGEGPGGMPALEAIAALLARFLDTVKKEER